MAAGDDFGAVVVVAVSGVSLPGATGAVNNNNYM